ncbi:MAG: DUF4870 domain-containing protein [Dehalogenimonas sp.]|uniref:DUF4870 domain-containing protein n=1 Tax=Candidatus Dehalogenimonas loeffleri TaxID=3127115 RepID=A0ABZ2J525_9CHLR|nr:DUF4870 domain-containing protein [Dehalogenimonas sp.]
MDDSSTGLKSNVAGLLCYLAAWVSGLIFYLVETKSQFVRFHAAQSIIVFGGLSIVTAIFTVIPFIGWVINAFLGIVAFVLWLVLMVKAYQGEKYKLPIAGDLAEQWAAKKV